MQKEIKKNSLPLSMLSKLVTLFFCLISLFPLNSDAGIADWLPLSGQWKIKSGQIEFSVFHILHAAHGKTLQFDESLTKCKSDNCSFSIKTAVKNFNTNDKERDSHLQEAVNIKKFPDLIIQGELNKKDNGHLVANFEIELAGKKQKLSNIEIKIEREWKSLRSKGYFELPLKGFIDNLPKLMGIAIEDKLVLQFDLTWEKVD